MANRRRAPSDRIRRDPIVKLADSYADVYSKSFLEALDWACAWKKRNARKASSNGAKP